ncbi:trigger factor [Micropruina sp.]|uniref:trigger factor n=1 Tax=Micropruina sp. TaxID=2737536 RepID=UPI002631391A|nr:trigger factor [Micropruina sp.]
MPSTVEQLSPSRAKLTVEIPFAELQPHLTKAYREIAQSVTIPGFRKGKVPSAVIDQRFGRGVVLQEAINAALPTAYGEAVDANKLVPLGDPEVEITKLEDGDLVEFVAEVDVRPELTLPGFDSLAVTVDVLADLESEVDSRIEMMRERFATTTEVDRPAAVGDVVTIDLAGTRDGEALADATAEGITYKIGSGGMLDGLDEAVTGLSAGESADFSSTLVGGPLTGEPADIHVTVSKVSEQQLPDLDDEFAQLVSEFDTVEEMRADLTTGVEQMLRAEQLNSARDKVLEDLVAQVEFELPAKLLATELEARHSQVEEQLKGAGLTLERYLETAEDEEADSPEAFWAVVDSRAEQSLRAQILLDAIADEHEVGVEQHELTDLIVRKAQSSGSTPEQELQHMMEHNHMSAWMQEIRRNKALGLILAQATVTDTDGATVEVAPVAPEADAEDEEEAPAEA